MFPVPPPGAAQPPLVGPQPPLGGPPVGGLAGRQVLPLALPAPADPPVPAGRLALRPLPQPAAGLLEEEDEDPQPTLYDLALTNGTFHQQLFQTFGDTNTEEMQQGLVRLLDRNPQQTPEQERFFRAALKSDAARVRLEALARDGYDVFHPRDIKTKTIFGEKVETAKFDQVQPTSRTWSRATQRAGSIALSVLAFPALLCKSFRQEYGRFGWTGNCESQEIAVPKELSEEEMAERQESIRTGRRYDPNDSESIKRYVHNAGTKPSMYLGHEFFIDNEAASRDGISSFLFAPNGDWSQSFSVVMYNPKNGQSIGNTDEIHRAIRAYCEQYRTMSDGLNPFIERSINSYLRLNHLNPDQVSADERKRLRDSLGRMFSLVVIDPDSGKTRVYHRSAVNDPTKAFRSFEPNPIAGFLQQFSPKGLVIEWDEHLKERVKSVYEGQKDKKFTDEHPGKPEHGRREEMLRELLERANRPADDHVVAPQAAPLPQPVVPPLVEDPAAPALPFPAPQPPAALDAAPDVALEPQPVVPPRVEDPAPALPFPDPQPPAELDAAPGVAPGQPPEHEDVRLNPEENPYEAFVARNQQLRKAQEIQTFIAGAAEAIDAKEAHLKSLSALHGALAAVEQAKQNPSNSAEYITRIGQEIENINQQETLALNAIARGQERLVIAGRPLEEKFIKLEEYLQARLTMIQSFKLSVAALIPEVQEIERQAREEELRNLEVRLGTAFASVSSAGTKIEQDLIELRKIPGNFSGIINQLNPDLDRAAKKDLAELSYQYDCAALSLSRDAAGQIIAAKENFDFVTQTLQRTDTIGLDLKSRTDPALFQQSERDFNGANELMREFNSLEHEIAQLSASFVAKLNDETIMQEVIDEAEAAAEGRP